MKTFALFILLAAFASGTSAEDKYPSAYPFDNEPDDFTSVWNSNQPPAGVPDSEDADSGGYVNLLQACDFSELQATHGAQNYGPYSCDGMKLFRKKIMGASDVSATYQYPASNCTAAVTAYLGGKWEGVEKSMFPLWGAKKTFAGMMGKKYDADGNDLAEDACTSYADCCPMYYTATDSAGKEVRPLMVASDSSPDGFRAKFLQEHQKYSCKESDSMYLCAYFFVFAPMCHENYLSPTKRQIIYPCPDLYARYVFSCTTRMTVISPARIPYPLSDYEPAAYTETLSAKQYEVSSLIFIQPDKVCHPYTYYFPALRKTPTTPTTSTTPSNKSTAVQPSSSMPSSVPASSAAVSSVSPASSSAALGSSTITATGTSGSYPLCRVSAVMFGLLGMVAFLGF